MSEFPLYDLMASYRDPISPMAEYLRDKDRPSGYVEARRKQELRQILTAFLDGQHHPITATMMAIETVLSATRHPLHHLTELAKNPTSFDHYFRKVSSPEDFQAKRKAHIDRLTAETFIFPYHNASFTMNDRDAAWVQELIDSLDQPDTKADLVVERLATRIVARRGHSISDISQITQALQKQRHDDARDALQHPNDQYTDKDLLAVMADYKLLGWTDSDVRDQYLTDKAIEQRRTSEIIDVLTAWKGGRHPLLVLADLMAVTLENLDQHYHTLIGKVQSEQQSEKSARREKPGEPPNEYFLVSILLKQDDLRRQARDIMRQMREPVAAYRGPQSNPELAAEIDGYIDHIVNKPQSSFDVIRSISVAILTDDAKELDRISSCLNEKEKKETKAREKRRPMGTLKTQAEGDVKERLKEIFARRAVPTEPSQKLTREIHIEPVGSGMIKPYPDGEDDGGWEEDIYGTVTARVTTYAISLIPASPDLTKALEERVKQALEEIADVEPAYAIPFDHESEPYERPYKSERDDYRQKYFSSESLHVEVKDGVVKIRTRLDLDDLWNLYYLLEDVIEPTEQIAAAMNGARYAEARGVLLSKDGLGTSYSNTPFRPEQRMGSLERDAPENYITAGLRDTFALYAIDEIGEEQFIHRIIMLADHVLMGQLVDPSGTFLPLHRLIARNEEAGTDIVTYDSALKDTVKNMLMLVAGVRDENTPLDRALLDRIREVGDGIRENMQAQVRQQEDDRWERTRRTWNRSGSGDFMADIMKDFKERMGEDEAEKLMGNHGEIDLGQEDTAQEASKPVQKEESRALARKANIAFRKGEIGATTDRTWRGTDYVSRSPGSIWVRKELPSSLCAFVQKNARGDINSVIKAIGLN